MSKGFVTVAENSVIDDDVVDYIRLAYGLALSIKATQSEVANISVITSNDTYVPDKYKEVFDEVLRVPWSHDLEPGPRFHNEPHAYWLTPYEETIKLEADILMVKDLKDIWNEYLKFKLFWFTSNVYTYRNEKVSVSSYREDFLSNSLPNVYNGMMYFRKGDFSTEFFKTAGYIFENWQEVSEQLLDHTRPKEASTDVVYALATKILDIEDVVVDDDFDFGFVHMKNDLQGWDRKYGHVNWYDNVQCFITDDLDIKVGHYKQILPFHYQQKSFLTDAIIAKYERHLGI